MTPLQAQAALSMALQKARHFIGATAPNPPVGAAAVNAEGRILSIHAHERAGTGHAEAKVLQELTEQGRLGEIDTLVITLEPCNHFGRTPPCTEAILKAGVKRVIYGAPDPNPQVAGQGARRLKEAGIDIELCQELTLRAECELLIRSFSHWARTGLPWVIVKTAQTGPGPLHSTMIPPPGQKTFTSPSSLQLAHELRRRADAIITGSGTVLADLPEFTVRHVPDHSFAQAPESKKRWLVVLDRRGRTPSQWLERERELGFEVLVRTELESAIRELGRLGAHEVLMEAGPSVSEFVLSGGLWNEHVLITQGNPDTVRRIQKEKK